MLRPRRAALTRRAIGRPYREVAQSSARTTICVEAPPTGVEANRRSTSVIGSPVRGASMGRSRPLVRSPYRCDWKQVHRRLDGVRDTRLRVTAAQTRSGAALVPEQLSRPTAASGTRRWQRRLGPWLGLTRPGGNDRGGGDFWSGAPSGDGPPTRKKKQAERGRRVISETWGPRNGESSCGCGRSLQQLLKHRAEGDTGQAPRRVLV